MTYNVFGGTLNPAQSNRLVVHRTAGLISYQFKLECVWRTAVTHALLQLQTDMFVQFRC